MGNYPILGDTCCRLTSLVWDKDRNIITEVWERLLDEQHEKEEIKKKPGAKIPKKPASSVKPTPKQPKAKATK